MYIVHVLNVIFQKYLDIGTQNRKTELQKSKETSLNNIYSI